LYAASHVGHVKAYIQLPTWLATLTDLDQGGTDPPSIAKADIGLADTVDDEVLPKGAGLKAFAAFRQLLCPDRKVRDRVGVDGLVQATMVLAVSLFVRVEAERAYRQRSVDLALIDGAEYSCRTERSGTTNAQFEYFKFGHGLPYLAATVRCRRIYRSYEVAIDDRYRTGA
jgi:hypothetical protein